MEDKYVGKIIGYERRKKSITLEQLSAGILSSRGLRRLEEGERVCSFFLVERLMERLGKSINKMEFLLYEKEYEIYYLRGKIEQAVEEGRLEEANRMLTYYEGLSLTPQVLHHQYLCKMRAVISSIKGEGAKALELLEEALRSTLVWWKRKRIEEGELRLDTILQEYPIGQEEISILLLWLKQMWESGREIRIDGSELLFILSRYYEEDEEARSDLFSKVCWILGSISMKLKEKEEAYYFTKEGERILAENRILLHLPQYLDRLVYLEELLQPSHSARWKEQRDALKEVLVSHGRRWDTREILLWKNFKTQEVYLISEIVEQERVIRNKTKEASALEMGIDPKTISRLESGTYKPKVETLKKIRDYYEICRNTYSTRIVVEDFYLLELERKISVLEHLNQIEEAEKLYLRLRKKLDLRWKVNRQYILYQDMIYDHQLRKISNEEALERCKKAFQVTRPYLEPDQVDKIILSRLECFIINYMGICYRKMGKREQTISLLKKAMKGYKKSKVDSKYYFHSLGLIYLNLIDNYEECNQFKEALQLCEEAIQYEIDCNKCSDLGYLISEKQYTIDRRDGKHCQEGKESYRQAFLLMQLMKREVQMKGLQVAYKNWYEENLISDSINIK